MIGINTKSSSPKAHRRAAAALLRGALPSLGVVSAVVFAQRLALPLAVLWLGGGDFRTATLALFGAVALSFVRARAADRVAAILRQNLLELYLRPFERGQATALPSPEVVTARLSTALPSLVGCTVDGLAPAIAAAVATPAVAALLAFELGPLVLLPLGVAGAVGTVFTVVTSRRVEITWTNAWTRARALLEALSEAYAGAVDLRAHGHARAFADALRSDMRGWSAAEGRARVHSAVATWGTLSATVAAGLGVSALLGPRLVPDGDVYRSFLLVLAAIPTLQTLVAGTGAVQSAREEIQSAACQLELADNATVEEADEPLDATAEIRLEDIDYAYHAEGRSNVALRGVNLVLAPGESVAIVGPNGAGKTTLLYVLLGVARPDRGRILVGGREARLDNRRFRARLAFLSQRPFELPNGSIADNLRVFESTASEGALKAALEMVGIWPALRSRADRDEAALSLPYGELSRGQARRVMLARALLREADLLVLDEPEAHLDPDSIAALGALLRRIAEGRRVVVVVHERSLAAFADRVIDLAPPREAELP